MAYQRTSNTPELHENLPKRLEWMEDGIVNAGVGGGVQAVAAADTSIVVGGTVGNPTVATGTLDVVATQHPPAADWSNNSHKITNLANAVNPQDAAAYGQTVHSVAATDTSVVVGGTATAPTLATNTLDILATNHPPAANWSNNSKKITNLANATVATDAAAFGQVVQGVTAADTSVVIGGTANNPTVATGTLDVIATNHPAAGDWSNNSHKITSVLDPTLAQDVATKNYVDKLTGYQVFNVANYGAVPDQFYVDATVVTGPSVNPTLSASITSGATSITVSSAASFPTSGNYYIAIDNEVMQVTAGQGTTTWTVSRAQQSTVAASHAASVSVRPVYTSATANFVGGDVGNNIVFLRTGDSSFLDQHTTIASVLSATAITVNNRSTRAAGIYSNIRFYLSRNGDQITAIQNAVNAASNAGGGIVFFPGVGYLIGAEIVLKNRVFIVGTGMNSTMVHLKGGLSAVPVVRNDTTSGNTAMICGIMSMRLDANRDRQTSLTVSTTTAASFNTGAATIDVTSAASLFSGGGVITVGTNKITYQDITIGGGTGGSDRLNSCTPANEGSTDASAAAGATVTQIKNLGAYFGTNPFNATPATAEEFDPHFIVRDVHIKYSGGDGIQAWGQSESRWDNIWVEAAAEIGFRPSYDSWIYNCTADGVGRMGFLIRGSSCQGSNNKAFFSGGLTAADGWGFFFEGYTNLEAGCKSFTACNAQDNKAGGYRIRNCQRILISGHADSNSTSSSGTYSAVTMEGPGTAGTTGCIINIMCTDRNNAVNQVNALNIVDAGVAGNQINITHGGGSTGQTGLGTAIKSSSVLTGGNMIQINAMGGMLTPAFAASYTPDPYAATYHNPGPLTAGITINAPTNQHLGCLLTVILRQDGTGSRTITWNATFLNTPTTSSAANSFTIGRFIYNGANWVGI